MPTREDQHVAYSIEAVSHTATTAADIAGLRCLFDSEYVNEFGPWESAQPYGYAPHDVHLIARADGHIIGHVGWQRRRIRVGDTEVTIAGVGGVLVSPDARGADVGRRLMQRAAESLSEQRDIDFGFLGCREEVVPFYLSCGWSRVYAAERSVGRDSVLMTHPPGPPLLIFPVRKAVVSWPAGMVDLRGRAW